MPIITIDVLMLDVTMFYNYCILLHFVESRLFTTVKLVSDKKFHTHQSLQRKMIIHTSILL